jgi:hypothetical protein
MRGHQRESAENEGLLARGNRAVFSREIAYEVIREFLKGAIAPLIILGASALPVAAAWLFGNWYYLLVGMLLVGICASIYIMSRYVIIYRKIERKRWNEIKSVKLGYISYYPFYVQGENTGFGPFILDRILGEDVTKFCAAPSSWDDILPNLGKKFELFATPLLETFERSRKCDFTAPLFYSNIGLYTSIKTAEMFNLSDMSLHSVVEWINSLKCDLKILYIKGELSQKRASKLRKELNKRRALSVRLEKSEDDVLTTLKMIANNNEEHQGFHYLMFSESFHARRANAVVKNILMEKELLYPVCYAVRSGDYVLRTRINIGLLGLAKEGSILTEFENYLGASGWITPEELQSGMVRKHFVSEWEQAA